MGLLKSRGAGPPFPFTTSVSLTTAPSVTAEEGGVRAGRPFPLPLSEDESSERRDTGGLKVRLTAFTDDFHEFGSHRDATSHRKSDVPIKAAVPLASTRGSNLTPPHTQ